MVSRTISDEVFELVCEHIETTRDGLQLICDKHNIKRSTFYDLLEGDKEKADRYTRAKERQADYLADLILEVAFDNEKDDTPFTGINHIQRDRLKVDSLKFIASKLKPKAYGDKVDITSKGEKLPSIPTQFTVEIIRPSEED